MAQINLIGKNILGYTVSEKLGDGAFGTVYKVIKTNASGRYVRALKHITIPTEKQYNSILNSMGGNVSKADNYFAQMLNNIISEIKILNDLSEKGVQYIVRYYENDIVVNDSPRKYDIFILMEHLTPFEDFIEDRDFFVRDVIKLGLDVLKGLKACHDNGIIHRDIKDDNIFVSDKGEYKIGDFGVSKILKDSSKAESLKGTPNFLAPEVYLGKESYTQSVDLYSLGIVLYRLLNYSRNPFLPYFPEQYYSQDEESAFEKRMRGEIPDLPSLGGEFIGRVIVQAILNSQERFQTADEFLSALEWAFQKTPKEVLDEKIKFENINSANEDSNSRLKVYRETMGEDPPSMLSENQVNENDSNSINKHLFESIGEQVIIPTNQDNQVSIQMKLGKSEMLFDKDIKDEVSPPTNKVEVLDKKILQKFTFAIPIFIVFIGIVAYFIVIPNIYGKVISFFDWLFTDVQSIIETIKNPNAVLTQIHHIILMRIFWWGWLISFITSLFFVGKQLHTKSEPNDIDALLIKKQPYFMIQDVSSCLKQLKVKRNSKELDSLIYAVKCLEEKLSIESDFGYGENVIITCENDIARQLQILSDGVSNIEKGDIDKNISDLKMVVSNINSLLRRRMELKKR